jgi:hypothetical protein
MGLAMTIIGVLTTTCEGATALVSRSLDGRPDRAEWFAMRLHLFCCPGCRRFDRQMKFLRQVMARLKERLSGADAPPGLTLPPDARERIRAALEEVSNPPSSP